MVWSWSHTQEAYDGLRARLEITPRPILEEIYAEWKANPRGHFHPDH